ncbi:type VI secretion system tube protein TssD [Lacinutrix chionoecetis]
MSIVSKLFIEDKEFNVLRFNFNFNQQHSNNGMPSSQTTGGIFNIELESTKDALFNEWMVHDKMMKNLKIKISQTHQVSKSRTIELLDVFCIEYKEVFDGVNNEPMKVYLKLSPAIMIQDGVKIFEWYWKETDLTKKSNSEPLEKTKIAVKAKLS